MLPSELKCQLEEILKSLTPDFRRKVNYRNYILKQRPSAARKTRILLRKLKQQEREIKRMEWKREKGNFRYKCYIISKLPALPFEKDKRTKYWLGKLPHGWDTSIGLGLFPNIETAKYVAYLLIKKS